MRKLSKKQFLDLKSYCLHSNSLYNSTLYTIKEYFKETGKYIGFNKLYHEMKTNQHYKSMPNVNSACNIVRLVDKNYRAFFTLLNRKQKGQYSGNPQEPKYRKGGDQFILEFSAQFVSLKDNKLKLIKSLRIPFTKNIKGKIKQVIIKPNGNYYEMYICVEEDANTSKVKNTNCLSIDLGLDNMASCFNNIGRDFIISGTPLKAYNQFYNKVKAKMMSKLEIHQKRKWSRKLNKLNINRNNWVNNYLNQSVALIIKQCKKDNISKVIIGYNESWKNGVNMGKRNNQNFTMIPFYKFKQKLEHKCASNGIEFIQQEESYTSKCSALDKEKIQKHENYLGSRVKRGLFKGTKYTINADINGAINIMRKAVGDEITFISKSIERCKNHPVKLNLFNLRSS